MTRSLLERIAEGDELAVRECIDRYGALVWSITRRLAVSAADAEDAVQEVFIELWSHASRFNPEVASEATFIAMIARRRLIDRWRKKKREPRVEPLSETVDPPAAESHDVDTEDEAARVAEFVATLKPDQQEVLKLSVYQGLTHHQIADHLEMPLGTVKTHVRRGLLRVRELLGVAGGQTAPEVAS